MPRTFRRTFSRRALPALLLVVAAALPFVLPGVLAPAPGAETYAASAFTSCGTSQNGGQYDEQKRLYMGCGTNVRIQEADGTWVNRAIGLTVVDVAPSPTGAYLYVIANNTAIRFNRRADGTYARDTVWKLPAITAAGWTFPATPVAISTDANGYIYASHNNPADSVVTRHKPDGTQIAWVGGYSDKGEPGKFFLNRGVATSRDGKYLYVVEKSGGRVQRFDYQVDGSYKPAKMWGGTDNNCGNGKFAAPGDVVVDPWGFVYVMDTTCARIQKFTADGGFVWSKALGTAVTNKSHRLAVDWRGSVYASEQSQKRLIRAAGTTPTADMPAVQPLPLPPFAAAARGICPVEDWTNGSGQAAKDGTVYVACGHSIYVSEADGTLPGRIALPAGAHYYDVAPSPDEAYLYVTRRLDTTATVKGRAELRRFNRTGAAGTLAYTLDATWKPSNFTSGGKAWLPQGQFVATDTWGDIYYSVGGWAGYYTGAWDGDFLSEASPAIVLKYSPAGAVKAQFIGETSGEFDVNMGITASRDGRTVWIVEHKAGRAQRFDYTATGEYHQTAATSTFGGTDATCAAATGLNTPYDIGLDPWGGVWVANTACRRADRFSPNGTRDYSVALPGLAHGIAVDLKGNAWLGQRNLWIKRSTQNPAPGAVPVPVPLEAPDKAGPVITALGVPNDGNVTTQTFALAVTATDAHRIAKIRYAHTDGIPSAWVAYGTPFAFTTTAGYGAKYVNVQLQDELGNEGAWFGRNFSYAAPNPCGGAAGGVDNTPPVLRPEDVIVPAISPTSDIFVRTTATDNVCVAYMRLADDYGDFGAWIPYNANQPFRLRAGTGTRGVYVQVKDAAGNESAWPPPFKTVVVG
ncbi:MAG: pknD 3 [Thermoleophilia bacterium]|nr:pknD 3 [Thermoleophilia bacterium]